MPAGRSSSQNHQQHKDIQENCSIHVVDTFKRILNHFVFNFTWFWIKYDIFYSKSLWLRHNSHKLMIFNGIRSNIYLKESGDKDWTTYSFLFVTLKILQMFSEVLFKRFAWRQRFMALKVSPRWENKVAATNRNSTDI